MSGHNATCTSGTSRGGCCYTLKVNPALCELRNEIVSTGHVSTSHKDQCIGFFVHTLDYGIRPPLVSSHKKSFVELIWHLLRRSFDLTKICLIPSIDQFGSPCYGEIQVAGNS